MARVTDSNLKQDSHNKGGADQPTGATIEEIKLSLLRPAGYAPEAGNTRVLPDEADLGLTSIIRALDIDGRHSRTVSAVLGELNSDPVVISYRQDVLYELLRLPGIVQQFSLALPNLTELAMVGRTKQWGETQPLPQVVGRLAELEIYVNCVEGLWSALGSYQGTTSNGSTGLLGLRAGLQRVRNESVYQGLAAELPRLRASLREASSITLGINLDAQLRPESATIVSVNQERFSGKGTLLQRLLGDRAAAEAQRSSRNLYPANDNRPNTPEHELFRELDRILEKVARPVAETLARYTKVSSAWLAALGPEIAFYLGAVRLVKEMDQAGLALCRPAIAPAAENAGKASGLYSLDLALRLKGLKRQAEVVPNEVEFSASGHIFIVTGPNSGGKTTYTRAVGQAQVLFQAGLPVPATAARFSPVDAIFTHFAREERAEASGGRLAQELKSLSNLFRQASCNSLILLNEPLTGTDHISARSLGKDLLAGLKLLGARAIFVTHLHELLEDTALDIASGGGIVSLVAVASAPVENGSAFNPTYKIIPGLPRALANAAELARQHGLSLPQITRTLRERGLITPEE
jgi:DNA mismatch repair protein MutS